MSNGDFTPNFGIENTIEIGGEEILNNLLEPETATSSPEDVSKLEESKKKETPKKEETKKEEPKKQDDVDTESLLSSLLEGEEEEPNDEDEPKDEPEKEEEEKKESKKEDTKVNQFSALSKDLFKLGVFSKDENEQEVEISTPEAFLERFNSEKRKGAIEMVNDFISQHGEDYQRMFQAIFVNGVEPKEYLSSYNNIQNFAEMDLSQEANQVAVIKQGLLEQGFEQEELNPEIDRLKNYGDLEKVAERYHKVLVKKEAQKLNDIEVAKQKELQDKAAYKQQYAQNVQNVIQEKLKAKDFDGIPLNPKLASEIQDFLLVDKYKTQTGEKLTDFDKAILDLKRPENHEKKVKIALLFKLLEKDPSLSTIQKAGVTKKSEALFGELARQKKTSVSSAKKEKESPSWWANNE